MRTQWNQITLKALMLGLVVGLSACGGNNTPPPPPAVAAPAPAPAVTTTVATGDLSGDYVANYIVPQLQNYYGNINVNTAATVQGITFAAGSIGWAQVYSQVVQMRRNATNCGPTSNPTSPWLNLNFGCFYSYMSTNPAEINTLQVATVSFANFPNYTASVYTVIDMLVSYNYSIWAGYYGNYYGYGYTGGAWPVYNNGYYNGNQISGGLSFNNGNLGINLGGIFNWGH